VIFKEDGSYIFPKEWSRKQKKRISNKIRKRIKAGHKFPATDMAALDKRKEEEEKLKKEEN